ncbi:MAG: hypothetical protein HOB41_02995 [Gemmatimonadetes bacterium]|nr:hypothetical protein [Gemmatimonadota bacterium]
MSEPKSAQPFVEALAEARSAPLPFILLSFNYGAYFLAALIALFMDGGISESEEWRIFIVGWLSVPPASLAAGLYAAHCKRTRYAGIESFYPLLLAANALAWVGYFAFHFPPPWLREYNIAPQALRPLVWFLPLGNFLVLLALKSRPFSFAKINKTWVYALLPIATLYVGLNFSGLQGARPNTFALPWPIFNPPEGKDDQGNYPIEKGTIFGVELPPLSVTMTSKLTTALQTPLPLLTGSRLVAWRVDEGEWIEPGRVIAEFESEFLHTEIRAQAAMKIKRKKYQHGEEIEPIRELCAYVEKSNAGRSKVWVICAALGLGLVPLLASRRKTWPALPIPAIAVDLAVPFVIFLLVFDLTYLFEAHHYNFFLGPVNDVLRGKSLLVDINCQYGVGVIYFLALFFELSPIPLNYQGFALLLNTLLVLQYALIYLLMRRVLDSQLFAIVALLLILNANYNNHEYIALPSTGPLRFGITYALLAFFLFRSRFAPQPWVQMVIYGLVGLSSLWSFESFAYTLTAYLCAELYTLFCAPNDLRRKLHHLLPIIGGPTAAIAGGHLLLALFTYLRAGAWPDWSHYLEYLSLYSTDEFGTLTIEAWRAWALFIAVYFLSLLLLLTRAFYTPRTDVTPLAFIAGLTGAGIVQFTYFLGRSHPNNLYHICIPLIFVAAYWFLYMQRHPEHRPQAFAHSTAYCVFVATFVFLAETGADFIAKWPPSPPYSLFHTPPAETTPWTAAPSHPEVSGALELIGRYATDKTRIALFLSPEHTTETLMLSQKSHIFPMSNPKQDDLLPSGHARALDYEHQWQPDDYLFITRDTPSLTGIQREVINKIMQQMQGLYADSTEHVYAIQLSTPQKGNP